MTTGSVSAATDETAVSIAKTASPDSFTKAGQPITYSYTVTNDGNTPLTEITVDDDSASIGRVCDVAGPLGPGDSATCTAGYVTTGGDVAKGSVSERARVTTHGGGRIVTADTSQTIVLARADAAIVSIAMTASPDSFTRAGQPITYSYTITNDGNTPLSDITVDDDSASIGRVCDVAGPLDPGEAAICTAGYVTTTDDAYRGQVSSSAVVLARGGGRDVSAFTSRTILLVGTGLPEMSIITTASPDSFTKAGQPITYSYTVTNVGAVPVDFGFVSNSTIAFVCDLPSPMDPGDSATCTAAYVTTGDDVERGSVTHTAWVYANDRGQNVWAFASRTILLSSGPRVSIALTASPDWFSKAGQPITYSYTATNNGPVPMTDIIVTDTTTSPDAPVCRLAGPLDPGKSATCTAGYLTTAADVHSGSVTNAASVAARAGTRRVSAVTSRTAFLTHAPGVSITATASPNSFTEAGQPITYTYTVTNDGNAALTEIAVNDPTTSPDEPVCELAGPLDPGDSAACTAGYVVSAPDVDRGSVSNVAAVVARTGGRDVSATTSRTIFLTDAGEPGVSITIKASPASFTEWTLLTYTYTVTNDGSTPLTDIFVSVQDFGTGCDVAGPLDPGDSGACEFGTAIGEPDVASGSFTNAAEVFARSGDRYVFASTSLTIFSTDAPGVSITTTASPNSFTKAGQPITYSYTVTNDGAVPLTDVTVEDPTTSPDDPVCELPPPMFPGDPPQPLYPGESATCTAGYVTTTADVERGSVTNAASVSARGGRDVSAFTSRTIFRAAADAPGVSIATAASPASFTEAGEAITYSYAVTNDGAVPLTGITVHDPTTSPDGPVCEVAGPLDPGNSATCTAGYVTTAADVDRGRVSNAVSVAARGGGRDVSAFTSRIIFLSSVPAVSITQTASPNSFTAAGQDIIFTYTVTNDGTVPLTGITVTVDDIWKAPDEPVCELTGALDAGDSATCTASYVTTADDVGYGFVNNVANVAAHGGGRYVSAYTQRSIRLMRDGTPGVSITQTASPNTFTKAGQPITFSYTVTNDGTVPLTDILVYDPTSHPDFPVACWLLWPLDPGNSGTCTIGYVTTADDVATGSVTKTAEVFADGGGREVSAYTSRTILITDAPAVAIVATASPSSFTRAGQPITYKYAVTNDGTTPLTDITVVDSRLGDVSSSCPHTALAVGVHMNCKARYTTTPSDLANGNIINTATATATAPGGVRVSAQAATTITLIHAPPPAPPERTPAPPSAPHRADSGNLAATGAPASTIWFTGLGFVGIIGGLITLTAGRRRN